jgi:hypothetical protein
VVTARREALVAALGAALLGVVAVTLRPSGTGWTWASPTAELRWYATALESSTTLVQLVGNLALLGVPAALAVLRWPALGRPGPLLAAGLSAGVTIEVLQWLLPLGRVVSPVDAVLNTVGAVAAGLLVAGPAPAGGRPG